MIKQISIKTRVGWISAFEHKDKIYEIKFGKLKKQIKSKILTNYKKKYCNFLLKKHQILKCPTK